MTRGRRRHLLAVVAIWTLPTASFVGLSQRVFSRHHITSPEPLADPVKVAVVSTLRTVLGDGAPPAHPELDRPLPGGGPVIVRAWRGGREIARSRGAGAGLAEAVVAASQELARQPPIAGLDEAGRRALRLQVDVVVGRAPLADAGALARSLGIDPGLEGLGVTLTPSPPRIAGRPADLPQQTREYLLLPDELAFRGLFGTSRPLAFIPDFRIGLDFERADMVLARKARLPAGGYGAARRRYFRFRTDGFIEPASTPTDLAASKPTPPLTLRRGVPPWAALTAESLRAAALAGGRYLVAHLADNGRYIYQRNLISGGGTNPNRPRPYSIPRHAGTTYFLAELYRLTGEEFLREPIERAFAHLGELVDAGGCSGTTSAGAAWSCVVDRGQTVTDLGSTALAVVALVEYQRATRDTRYLDLARRLTEWLLFMQRSDGSFTHRFRVADQFRDERAHLLYYTGEAALALARMHEVTGEERYRDAAERALDHLVGWYDFFVGGFFYGEEHWTCIAAEAAHPAIAKREYAEFCAGFAAFQRAQQPAPGEFPEHSEYAGSYNVTPFIVPQNTPAGSRTEAVISAYLLAGHHGLPRAAIKEQIRAALHYTLGQQVRADSAYAMPANGHPLGGVAATPVDRTVRIDYVQHVGSAMIRGAPLFE